MAFFISRDVDGLGRILEADAMEQLGHFPMSENPQQFRRYIAPVLGEIHKQSIPTKQGEYL